MGTVFLVEALKGTTDPLKAGIIQLFLESSEVLRWLPFINVTGRAFAYNTEETLPGVAWRGINGTYTASTGIENPQTETMKVLGGEAKVDSALITMDGGDDTGLMARQVRGKVKAAALDYTESFFNGNAVTAPAEMDGLIKRIRGSQLITSGTAAGAVLTLAMLDEALEAVPGADVIFCNRKIIRKTNALMRAAGQAIETVTPAFGKQLLSYAGVPLGPIDRSADGTKILPFTEHPSDGSSANSTSIYPVRFGDDWVTGLQNPVGIEVTDFGKIQASVDNMIRIEWVVAMAIFNGAATARLYGVKDG